MIKLLDNFIRNLYQFIRSSGGLRGYWFALAFLGYSVFGIGLAGAVDNHGSFAIKGIGASSCAVFREVSSNDAEAYRQFGGWMNGYISALNEAVPDTFDLISFEDSDTLIAYVSNYCEKYPKHRFMFAVKAVVTTLELGKITEQGQYVVFGGTEKIRLHQQTVDWIVQELIALKYLSIKFSASQQPAILVESLKSYQKDHSLPETGLPTQETLVRLLRKPLYRN